MRCDDSAWMPDSSSSRLLRSHTMSDELAQQLELLLEAARNYELSDAEKEEQRRSFAYGNAKMVSPHETEKIVR